jgi:hypothetical protein
MTTDAELDTWIEDALDNPDHPLKADFTEKDLKYIVDQVPEDLFTMAHNALEEIRIANTPFDWRTWAIEQLNIAPCIYQRHSANDQFMANMPFTMEEEFWTALLLKLLKESPD